MLVPQFLEMPQDYTGTGQHSGAHLVIQAVETKDPAKPCDGDVVHERQITVGAHEATLWACGELGGRHAEHVVLTWRSHGVNNVLSAHGHTEVNMRMLNEMAKGVQPVSP